VNGALADGRTDGQTKDAACLALDNAPSYVLPAVKSGATVYTAVRTDGRVDDLSRSSRCTEARQHSRIYTAKPTL